MLGGLQAEVRTLVAQSAQTQIQLVELQEAVARARGGWHVMVLLAGLAAGVGGIVGGIVEALT